MACYWLDEPVLRGQKCRPKDGGIAIIGSGLTGVSTAYWLLGHGYQDVTLIDYQPETAASFRNCGHILHGTVESMKALTEVHGAKVATDIWQLSVDLCQFVKETITKLALDCHYAQDGYLVMAIDESEHIEIQESIDLLSRAGFENHYVSAKKLEDWGFAHTYGGRFEPGSAQAHPTKFRNGLLKFVCDQGLRYHSGWQVLGVDDLGGRAQITLADGSIVHFDGAVIAANAYSNLLSEFFAQHRLLVPFRGQIIASQPLPADALPGFPHSFDHGYEYALRSPDGRLILGGWRNHTAGETGTYDLQPNNVVERGLQEFARQHYRHLPEDIQWPYSWSGIMAASNSGFPFIGPTNSPIIFTCCGYTGHGFSWAHGSAKILADIIMGHKVPDIVHLFRPSGRLP